MSENRIPFTPAGYEKLKKEIDFLKSEERPRVLTELEEARAHGDLSENAEYHAAKEKLGHIDGRVADYENRLSLAEVIDPKKLKGQEKVLFGAIVKLLDLDTDEEVQYQIVGDFESDVASKKISINSPIARGLIGKKVGDDASIKTPKGIKEFEILDLDYK
jgi:transcription elongation factor GreA